MWAATYCAIRGDVWPSGENSSVRDVRRASSGTPLSSCLQSTSPCRCRHTNSSKDLSVGALHPLGQRSSTTGPNPPPGSRMSICRTTITTTTTCAFGLRSPAWRDSSRACFTNGFAPECPIFGSAPRCAVGQTLPQRHVAWATPDPEEPAWLARTALMARIGQDWMISIHELLHIPTGNAQFADCGT